MLRLRGHRCRGEQLTAAELTSQGRKDRVTDSLQDSQLALEDMTRVEGEHRYVRSTVILGVGPLCQWPWQVM